MKKIVLTGGAAIASLALAWSSAHAEMNGKIDDLNEAYLIYQGKDACPYEISPVAEELLIGEIKRLEQQFSASENEALWAQIANDMPKVKMLGICGAIYQEIMMIEQMRGFDTPGAVPAKPSF